MNATRSTGSGAPPAAGGGGLWFRDNLVIVRVPSAQGVDGMSVLEHLVPADDSPPLHLHRTEDELFHLLEGELKVRLAGTERRIGPGEIFLAPKGIPHAYRVVSKGPARFLTVTVRGDFERLVRALARPAPRLELPPPSGPPSPEEMEALARSALECGIEIVGPPLE